MAGSVVDTTEVDAPTDADLITAVRGGDNAAYGVLFDRHRAAAERLARQLVRGPDADDLVAESFTRVLVTLQQGKGPDESFRAYLLTAMRRFHIDRIRAGARVRSTGDEAELDRTVDWVDPAEMRFESGAAAQAFAALPERWQTVLWHLDVEGQKPAEVAPLLGMSANSISALAYRAREGLRQSYLQQHLGAEQREACRSTTEKLGAYVRGGLAARDTGKVEAHLDECARCTGLYLELREINGNLAAWLAPALLGAAATGYLTAGTTAGAVGAAAVLKGAAGAITAPFRALGPAGGSAAAGVTVVAVAAGIAVAANHGSDPESSSPSATQAAPAATAAPSSPASDTPSPTTATPTPTPIPTPSVSPTAPVTTVPVVPTAPAPTTPPAPRPTPTRTTPPSPTVADVSVRQLGPLRQDVRITISPYPGPVQVTLRYGGLGGTVSRVSDGWTCHDPIGPIVCIGDPAEPLRLRVIALFLLGSPKVSVAPAGS